MTVDYFTRPEVPGRNYFRCERMRATISTEACAGFWRGSNGGGHCERDTCLRCPIGAMHAGEAQASTSPLRLAPICARCHRPSSRLIGGMRCVSCYNRERELLRGRNAKGTAPVKLTCLARRRVRYMAGDEPCSLVVQHSLDTDELVVAALRDSSNRVRFGFGAAVPLAVRQLRLF
jgi:hypothetical protein